MEGDTPLVGRSAIGAIGGTYRVALEGNRLLFQQAHPQWRTPKNALWSTTPALAPLGSALDMGDIGECKMQNAECRIEDQIEVVRGCQRLLEVVSVF